MPGGGGSLAHPLLEALHNLVRKLRMSTGLQLLRAYHLVCGHLWPIAPWLTGFMIFRK